MIYVLYFLGSDYESQPVNLGATSDEGKATAELNRRQAQYEKVMKIRAAVHQNFRELQTKNPVVLEPYPIRPKGPARSDKEAMKVYQRELSAFGVEQQRIGQINRERNDEWIQTITVAQTAFVLTLDPTMSQDDLDTIRLPYGFFEEGTFQIDEVPEL